MNHFNNLNIKILFLIILNSLIFPTIVFSYNKPNLNEKLFIEYGDVCAHLAGEVGDQTPERTESLGRGIDQTCPQAIRLYKKVLKQRLQHPNTHKTFLLMNGIAEKELTVKQKQLFCSTLSKEDYDWICK